MLRYSVKAEILSLLFNFQIVSALNQQMESHAKVGPILILILPVISSLSGHHFDSCSGLSCFLKEILFLSYFFLISRKEKFWNRCVHWQLYQTMKRTAFLCDVILFLESLGYFSLICGGHVFLPYSIFQ